MIHFRRTTTASARLGDQEFEAGEKVVLFYNSANRDEDVFDDPFTLDLTRQPNDHVGFGGPGPHFCLGAHLARREITVMFRELFTRVPDIEVTGEPDRLLSAFIHGIKHLPCSFLRPLDPQVEQVPQPGGTRLPVIDHGRPGQDVVQGSVFAFHQGHGEADPEGQEAEREDERSQQGPSGSSPRRRADDAQTHDRAPMVLPHSAHEPAK